jgi:hypothetical protein
LKKTADWTNTRGADTLWHIYMHFEYEEDAELLGLMLWMLYIIWEVLALCLAVWIAVKHFRDLQQLGPSIGSTIGDCFRVLIKSHMLYFAR